MIEIGPNLKEAVESAAWALAAVFFFRMWNVEIKSRAARAREAAEGAAAPAQRETKGGS